MQRKSGIIPYHVEGGQLRLLFAISSDAYYGGHRPQIVKGRSTYSDGGPLATALREGHEEIGLKPEWIARTTLVYRNFFIGQEGPYMLNVYGALLHDPESSFEFNDGEIKSIIWMTPQEFAERGREDQRPIVAQFEGKLSTAA